MKQSIFPFSLVIIFLFFFSSTFAQITTETNPELATSINKGNWLIGGNMHIRNSTNNNFSTSNPQIRIAPIIGYFIADKFLVGTGLSWGHINFKGRFGNDFKVNTFQASPLLRYYLSNLKIKPYLQLNGILRTTKNSSGNLNPTSITFNNSALLGQLGFDLFLSKNVAFNVNLSRLITGDGLNANTFNEFYETGAQDGIIIGAGMNFYLSGKKFDPIGQSSSPLVDRYFKKGNKTIGIVGTMSFDPFILLGSVYLKKFKNTKTRRNLLIDTFFGKGIFGSDFGGLVLLRPELERFIPLNNQSFFAPSAGISLVVSSADSNTELLVNAQLYPKLVYFTNKLLLDAGFQFNTPFTQFSGDTESEDWTGSIVVGGDYFLQSNLSLRAEWYIRSFGFQQFGYSPIYDVLPNNIFRIGINYFIEK